MAVDTAEQALDSVQRYGAEGRPDLMTLAKGLTGAHAPLGAVVDQKTVAHVNALIEDALGKGATAIAGARRIA